MKKLFVLLPLCLSCFSFALAQESATPSPATSGERLAVETAEKGSAANKGIAPEKEIKPHLPTGYSKWIDGVQKEKIYQIQKEYNLLIGMLQQRIDMLKKERDAAVESVLTPEQKGKLKKQPNRKQTVE
jgi:Spy/CpxP family protein refolding chaperone